MGAPMRRDDATSGGGAARSPRGTRPGFGPAGALLARRLPRASGYQ